MASVLSKIKNNHLFSRLVCLIISTFILTLTYNLFLVPNKIVTGGMSGLAILIEEIFHLSTSTFINISNIILILLSFLLLGRKKTIDQIIGCVTYILMINLTAPIAKNLNFVFQSEILLIVIISIFYGICNGLIYRSGFSTGGSDFISLILSDKLKFPLTKINFSQQIIIIIFSTFILGIHKIMLSIFIIYVSNEIANMILFGVSTSKMVYVISSENKKIEDYIINKINTGTTEIKVNGGVLEKKRPMLMCVIHNAQYAKFKNDILSIDPKAFILANRCYEVSGGVKLQVLPF